MSNDVQNFDANEFVKIWKDIESGLFHIDIKLTERVIVNVNGKEYCVRVQSPSSRGEQERIFRVRAQDSGNPIYRRVPPISRLPKGSK